MPQLPHQNTVHHESRGNAGPRTLTIQQLERRYAFSVAAAQFDLVLTTEDGVNLRGGFVNVSPQPTTLLYSDTNLGDLAIGGSGGFFLSVDGDSVTATSSDLFFSKPRELNGVVTVADSIQVETTHGFRIERIPLPEVGESNPIGGTMAVEPRPPFAAPPLGEALGDVSFLASWSGGSTRAFAARADVGGNPQQAAGQDWWLPGTSERSSSSEFALSRGRAVSFRVASIVPPATFGESAKTPSGLPDQERQAAEAVTETLEHAEKVFSAHTGSDEKVAAAESPLETVGATGQVTSFERGERSTMPHHLIGASVSESEANAAGREAAPIEQSAEKFAPEDSSVPHAARDILLADWNRGDLIAAPVLLALAGSTISARPRRDLSSETVQTPPKRNANGTAL